MTKVYQLVKAFQVICKDSERYTDRKMSQKEAKKYDYEIRKMIRRATFQEKNHRYFAETPDDDVHEEQTAIMQETKESQIKDLEISEEELGILAIDVRDIEKNVISDDELAEAVKKEITSIAANGFNTLTPTRTIAHEIKVETGAKPVTHAPRKTPFALKKDFKQVIEEMEEAKLIRPSKSNWCSPVKLVKKKDNSIRVTCDCRKLNKHTIKDCYPIPRIDDMIFRLAMASVFTVMDLASGYYQVPMEESSKKYTAFTCEYGLFEYNVMPMGLMNATATFQRLMNKIFDGLIGEIMFVYLDYIIIFSRNAEEHIKHVVINI